MALSKLSLKNMIFYGHHGVYLQEKELGQQIEVDVDLWADFSQAGSTDSLVATINYVDIYAAVKEIVEQGSYDLIEAMAMAINHRLLHDYEPAKISVRVRKPHPPVGGLLETVEFEVTNN